MWKNPLNSSVKKMQNGKRQQGIRNGFAGVADRKLQVCGHSLVGEKEEGWSILAQQSRRLSSSFASARITEKRYVRVG